jgi:HAD superfamily hydrolase (TIGR01549 family)
MISWVVFDAMGVIFTVSDDTNDLLAPFIWERNPEISREAINEIYIRASLGQISSRRLWEEVGLGGEYPEVEPAYLARLTLDPGFVPVARRLAERFSLGLLSNDLSEWSACLRAKHFLDFLSAVTISGDAGCRKPSPEIYERFLADSNARPQECIFIDDKLKNLAAAAALGMRTIRFARQPEESGFSPDGTIESFGQLEGVLVRLNEQEDRPAEGAEGVKACGERSPGVGDPGTTASETRRVSSSGT